MMTPKNKPPQFPSKMVQELEFMIL